MTFQHTNRKGDAYLLQAGKTRTGKPRYWFGRKLTGEPLDAIPPGYEVREDPTRAQVTLRKIQRTDICPMEAELLSEAIRTDAGRQHFIVDVEVNSLVVYLPGMSELEADRTIEMFAGGLFSQMSSRMIAAKASMMLRSDFDKMMRFELVDADERYFVVKRWCFRGSVDDWILLSRPAPLQELIHKYVEHLGKESFFDLM